MQEVIRRGLMAILEEGRAEFLDHLRGLGIPDEMYDVAKEALLDVPLVLKALNDLTWTEPAPLSVRSLFPALISYALRDEDLLPYNPSQRILGLLDDAYLIMSGALRLSNHLATLETPRIESHIDKLSTLLPGRIRVALDAYLDEALAQANLHAVGMACATSVVP